MARLKGFIEQAKTIYFFFLLGDRELQARYVNGLFEHCLTEKERAEVWAEYQEARKTQEEVQP